VILRGAGLMYKTFSSNSLMTISLDTTDAMHLTNCPVRSVVPLKLEAPSFR
jgi:hypothetical protein